MNKKYLLLSVATIVVVAGATIGALSFAQTAGTLTCFPAMQSVTLGQSASVSATGGDGTYTWSSPDLSITNPNGSGFSANFASTGVKTLTVTSAGLTTTCIVNVLAQSTVSATTPGLPNTGGGYGQ